jgi:hypothetical protein
MRGLFRPLEEYVGSLSQLWAPYDSSPIRVVCENIFSEYPVPHLLQEIFPLLQL